MKTKIPHLILAGMLGISTAHAATVSIDDSGGARIYSTLQNGSGTNVVQSPSESALNVGTKNNSNGFDMHAGYVFQMTGLTPWLLENKASFADFSVSATGGQGQSAYNIDLYVNRTSSSSTFNTSDYQVFDQLIMEDFWVVNDGLGNFSLDATGQANLLSWLQSNWVEDDYVFFTLKADVDTAPSFIMGEDLNANTIFGSVLNNDSLLTITVPEPSSTALLGLGGLALMLRRKR